MLWRLGGVGLLFCAYPSIIALPTLQCWAAFVTHLMTPNGVCQMLCLYLCVCGIQRTPQAW